MGSIRLTSYLIKNFLLPKTLFTNYRAIPYLRYTVPLLDCFNARNRVIETIIKE
jgi:hypothetical protein